MKKRSAAFIAGGCAFVAACFSLDVNAIQPVQGINYTRDSVLKDPQLMEAVVAGAFVSFWSGINVGNPWIVFGIFGEELTSSAIEVDVGDDDIPVWAHVAEPRTPFNNGLTGGNRLGRDPWGFFYEANSSAVELGTYVTDNDIRMVDPVTGADNTLRFLTFAKWLQGMSHIQLGLIFDSAAIVNRDVDLTIAQILPFKGYKEVLDSGVKWLEESIAMAATGSFLLPLNDDLWIYNVGVSSEQLTAVAHSYIARALVYRARTPEEVAEIDWEAVKEHLALGTTEKFGPRGHPQNSFVDFAYRRATTSAPRAAVNNDLMCAVGNTNVGCSLAGAFRVDVRIVGPSDTSGNYQRWLDSTSTPSFATVTPIVVSTPDQRIQALGNTAPGFSPVFFKLAFAPATPTQQLFPDENIFGTSIRGSYYVSHYWNSTRALDNREQFPATGGGRNRDNNNELRFIQDDMLVPAEMNLLLAEAHFRSSPQNLAEVVRLVNISRQENGILPPVTVAGVPPSTPTDACVPRRWDGSCGDLWDALVYEKRIETYGTGIAFYDARRWGCLAEGTPTMLPVPGHQLNLSAKTVYTYGGTPGALGSAPKPTNCPLLWKP